jgi:hypothetical protein
LILRQIDLVEITAANRHRLCGRNRHPVSIHKTLTRRENLLVQPRGRIARNAYVFDLVNRDACPVEAVLNGPARKPRTMLDAIEALFFHRSDYFAVANDGRRRVAVIRVYPEDVQSSSIAF